MLGRNILENSKVIGRATIACENSGHSVSDDFPGVRKIIEAGEASIPVMKINDEYKPLYYGIRTEDSLVLFEDEKLEHIVKCYKRKKMLDE